MNDYQQKRMESFVLPQPVYRQALWAVKDLLRLKAKLEDCRKDAYQICERDMMLAVGYGAGRVSDRTGAGAVEIVQLEQRIEAIESAFDVVPEEYRWGVAGKLVYGMPYTSAAHENTWKKWQQRCLYQVAVNLHLL